jgi:catecholate siderophore receptor
MKPVRATSILALFLLPLPAAAQSATNPDSVAKASAPHALDAVKVVANRARSGYARADALTVARIDLPLRDTPRAVSIVTGRLIADQSMQSMADVVRYVPGVSMGSGEGHRDAPTIRGNSSTADFFVDGVRDDAQYLRDLYNVDRVEVLKGSEALLFGRGGGGGVINRITRQATWAPVASITLEGGSFDHRRGLADYGRTLGGRAAARLNALRDWSGGFRDAATLER